MLTETQQARPKSVPTKKRNWLLIASVATTVFFWSSAFPGIRAGLQSYSPAHLALLRFGCASLVLLALARPLKIRRPAWREVVGMGMVGWLGIGFYNLALNSGETQVETSSASFVVNASPVITALLAAFWLGERLNDWGWLGSFVSFGGVALVSLSKSAGGLHFEPAVGLILVAALMQSLYFVLQKPYLKKYRPVEFTAYAVWSVTLFLMLFSPGLPQAVGQAAPQATLAVIYLGIFPAALAYVSWAYVLAKLPASRAASFLYLVPLLATGLGWLWQGEVPPALAFGGGLVTLGGVALVGIFGKTKPPNGPFLNQK